MAGPEDRIFWITHISENLRGQSWVEEDLVLAEFGVPEYARGGDRDEVRVKRLQKTRDEVLEALFRFATGASPKPQATVLAGPSKVDLLRLWGAGSPRIFLSHKAEYKADAKVLKDELARFGAASFVAHDDIEPTRAWQLEIERALASMEVLVALLTSGFQSSWWTNQEVGIALGRDVPVVCVRIDEDPRGFVGSTQAIAGAQRKPAEIAKALIGVMSAQTRLSKALLVGLVNQWEAASSFEEGIRVMGLLDACKSIPADLLERIESAFESNDQLHNSVGVNKRYPSFIARMKTAGT
jgi:TIR domain